MKKNATAIALALLLAAGVFAQDPGFQLLEVEGLRVTIDEIRFARNYSDSTTSGSIEVGQTVDLTGDINDVFSGGVSLRLEFGERTLSYDHISVQLVDGVSILGYTYLEGSGTYVYTSSSGIKETAPGQPATWSAPPDYGYLLRPYLYHAADNGEQLETTHLADVVTYDPEDPLDISLLVDTFQVAYYWDGDNNTRHGFVKSWNAEDSSNFPSGTSVIGVSYLPLYVSVNQELSPETYVVAEDSDLSAPLSATTFFDQKRTMTMTLVLDAAGDFFVGRTANWDYLDISLRLPQFVTEATGSGPYALTLESYQNGWTQNSTITNFTRLSLGQSSTATFTDSTGGSQTIEYKRVR